MAEMSVMMGRCNEAETILLHNGKIREAIELCVRMHRWERVYVFSKCSFTYKMNNSNCIYLVFRLDVAKTHKRQGDIDWVLQQRRKYLDAINREEHLPAFKQLNNQTN